MKLVYTLMAAMGMAIIGALMLIPSEQAEGVGTPCKRVAGSLPSAYGPEPDDWADGGSTFILDVWTVQNEGTASTRDITLVAKDANGNPILEQVYGDDSSPPQRVFPKHVQGIDGNVTTTWHDSEGNDYTGVRVPLSDEYGPVMAYKMVTKEIADKSRISPYYLGHIDGHNAKCNRAAGRENPQQSPPGSPGTEGETGRIAAPEQAILYFGIPEQPITEVPWTVTVGEKGTLHLKASGLKHGRIHYTLTDHQAFKVKKKSGVLRYNGKAFESTSLTLTAFDKKDPSVKVTLTVHVASN